MDEQVQPVEPEETMETPVAPEEETEPVSEGAESPSEEVVEPVEIEDTPTDATGGNIVGVNSDGGVQVEPPAVNQ